MGPVALATGLGQVAFTSLFGYFIALALGMGQVEALYVAVALTFSSTIIIVKLLSDKKEIDSLHGRIALGFLIVQDICVVLAMIVITSIGAGGAEDSLAAEMLLVLAKGVLLLGFVAVLIRWVLPRVLHLFARSQELLILFAIAFAVAMATLGEMLGFSAEVGAFLAGIALATTQYRDAMGARLITLRDFLLLFFFISLGAQLDLSTLGDQVIPALILSVFVLVGNPIIVLIIMGRMGYRKRTGFLAGLTVAQISEFSLILAALGLSLGHIEAETLGLVTLVGLITITLSTYMILYSGPLYERLAPMLTIFERRVPYREIDVEEESDQRFDVIIFGLGRYGTQIAQGLRNQNYRVLGVDFDPQTVTDWKQAGLHAIYGDAADPDFADHLPHSRAKWVISTMPEPSINRVLLDALRHHGYRGKVGLTAHNRIDADALRSLDVSLVLQPFSDAAVRTVEMITGRSPGADPATTAG